MATYWVTEALPLAVTALLPIVLFPLLGILSGATVASAYIAVSRSIFVFRVFNPESGRRNTMAEKVAIRQ